MDGMGFQRPDVNSYVEHLFSFSISYRRRENHMLQFGGAEGLARLIY